MNRIKSYAEIEKSRKKKTFWVSVVMLSLLVTSTAGFAFLSGGHFGSSANNEAGSETSHESQNTDYNNLRGNDENITSIPVDIGADLNSYSGANVYIDSDDEEATRLIGSALRGYASRISQGCYGACEEDLPEKNCLDNLIVYRESNVSRVYQNQSCVFIEGNLDSVRAFAYKLSGII